MPKANRLRRHNWGCSCQGCYLACAGLWRPVRVGPGVCTGRGGAAAARALCARTRVEFGGWARLRHGRAAAGRARSHSCLAPDLPWHVNRSRACGSGCGGRDGVGRERGHGGLLAVERREVGCKIAPIPHCRFPQLHLGIVVPDKRWLSGSKTQITKIHFLSFGANQPNLREAKHEAKSGRGCAQGRRLERIFPGLE